MRDASWWMGAILLTGSVVVISTAFYQEIGGLLTRIRQMFARRSR